MTENNKRQAYFPEGAEILENPNGTAPGCLVEKMGKKIFLLPGPPREMIPMFENSVIKILDKMNDWKLESRFLRVFGIGESSMETLLMDLIDSQTNPTVAPYAKEGEVTLRVTAKSNKDSDANELLMPFIEVIQKRIGSFIYSINGESIEEVVLKLLLEKSMTVSFAESCTGGLISGALTSVSGASKVLKSSYVTYSNISKISDLGVKPETIDEFGAVSSQTVIEMALGARKKSNSDIALSVSGIAGPEGGSENKPVGLVFLSICGEKGVETKKVFIHGDRNRVRNLTVLHAFDMIRRYVCGIEINY
jgi:nicotinamide-nucleotide amidase